MRIASLAGASHRRPRGVALYVSPHQDDELITLGGAITQDVADGYDVRVMLATDGASSGLRTSEDLVAFLGYTPTVEQFGAARDREFAESVRRMGATPIHIPAGERQADGSADATAVAALVQAYSRPGWALRGTAPTDYHRDHQAVGNALAILHADGYGNGDTRLCLPAMFRESHAGGRAMTAMGRHGSITMDNLWPYQHQELPDWWGIGFRSVESWLMGLVTTDCRTFWYPPEAI